MTATRPLRVEVEHAIGARDRQRDPLGLASGDRIDPRLDRTRLVAHDRREVTAAQRQQDEPPHEAQARA
jgi:hypothetical protein